MVESCVFLHNPQSYRVRPGIVNNRDWLGSIPVPIPELLKMGWGVYVRIMRSCV